MKYTTKAWIARDKDGAVSMFRNRPDKQEEQGRWTTDDNQYKHITWWSDEFPELSWKDDVPRKIEISMELVPCNIVQKIEVGKHILNIFNLECVISVDKRFDGGVMAMVREFNGKCTYAYEGDFICQMEDGNWTVIRKGNDQ